MTELTDAPPPAEATAGMRPLQGSHVWYELMTTDPDSARAFYAAVVPGWSIGDRLEGEQDYRMIGRSDGGFAGGVLKLTDEMRQHGARPIWLGYVGVDDVDATVASIESMGGKVLMPAFDIPQGRIAMVADPQGAPFYVMTPVPPAGQDGKPSDVFSADQPQRVSWNELSTSDPDSARRFYGDLFGWGSEEFMPMGELGEYRFFDHGGIRLGAVYHPGNEGFTAKRGPQPKWRYYIRVPSIAKARESAEATGGTIHMGPHQVPTGDWIIIGSDPQGAEFALVGEQ